MPSSILIYFPCISKSITFPLSTFVQRLLDHGHDVTFATSYILNNKDVTNVEVGAGIRHWAGECKIYIFQLLKCKISSTLGKNNFAFKYKCTPYLDVTASQHLFAGKDLLETNLFQLSMEANSDAIEKLLNMNKKWDTVIVYPAFGNEVHVNFYLNIVKYSINFSSDYT